MKPELFHSLLVCPECGDALQGNDEVLACARNHSFSVIGGIPRFVSNSHSVNASGDDIIHRLKLFFKKYPNIFSYLYNVIGAWFLGKSPRNALAHLGDGSIIFNVGSGLKVIRPDAINIDFQAFENVDVVADIYHLPFRSCVADAVVSECVGEHLRDPQRSLAEIYRVLKPGGLIYISLPFIESFHSSPDDFYRWTHEGLDALMSNAGFSKIELGIVAGPSSALSVILSEWLATLLSFGSMKIYQVWLMFFMVITTPIKVFDFLLIHFSSSRHSAFLFYYIGKKIQSAE